MDSPYIDQKCLDLIQDIDSLCDSRKPVEIKKPILLQPCLIKKKTENLQVGDSREAQREHGEKREEKRLTIKMPIVLQPCFVKEKNENLQVALVSLKPEDERLHAHSQDELKAIFLAKTMARENANLNISEELRCTLKTVLRFDSLKSHLEFEKKCQFQALFLTVEWPDSIVLMQDRSELTIVGGFFRLYSEFQLVFSSTSEFQDFKKVLKVLQCDKTDTDTIDISSE